MPRRQRPGRPGHPARCPTTTAGRSPTRPPASAQSVDVARQRSGPGAGRAVAEQVERAQRGRRPRAVPTTGRPEPAVGCRAGAGAGGARSRPGVLAGSLRRVPAARGVRASVHHRWPGSCSSRPRTTTSTTPVSSSWPSAAAYAASSTSRVRSSSHHERVHRPGLRRRWPRGRPAPAVVHGTSGGNPGRRARAGGGPATRSRCSQCRATQQDRQLHAGRRRAALSKRRYSPTRCTPVHQLRGAEDRARRAHERTTRAGLELGHRRALLVRSGSASSGSVAAGRSLPFSAPIAALISGHHLGGHQLHRPAGRGPGPPSPARRRRARRSHRSPRGRPAAARPPTSGVPAITRSSRT